MVALPDQIFHEPIGHTVFRTAFRFKQCRRQAGRLQVQINDQDPLPFASKVPCENRSGGAASDAAFDREQRATPGPALTLAVADCPPIPT